MSTDLLGIESLISLAYESWARVLEIGLGVGILAAFSGAAAVFTLIPTISKRQSTFRRRQSNTSI